MNRSASLLRAAGTCVLFALCSGTAAAQEAPHIVRSGGEAHVEGQLTIDGVTYSADELESLLAVLVHDPAALGDLPQGVRDALYTLQQQSQAEVAP